MSISELKARLKTMGAILGLLIGSVFSIEAQGVLLGPGDTLSIGFNRIDACHATKAAPGSAVTVGFLGDILDPGENLRLEMPLFRG